jgi:HNH endonuclease
VDGETLARFEARVVRSRQPNGCWLWTGGRYGAGYGALWSGGVQHAVHRLSYEHYVGPIPAGFQIDHVRSRGCASRLCVNPAHLEAVTQKENILRSDCPSATNARKTHCKRGHSLADALIIQGKRRCRTCNREGVWRRPKAVAA